MIRLRALMAAVVLLAVPLVAVPLVAVPVAGAAAVPPGNPVIYPPSSGTELVREVDLTADGILDLVFENRDALGPAGAATGAVWVVAGGFPLPTSVDLSGTAQPLFTAYGAASGDRLHVESAGVDLTGDGIFDLILEARTNGGVGRGAVYVFRGGPAFGGIHNLALPSSADLSVLGPAGNNLTYNFSGEGDLTGDGLPDLYMNWYQYDESPTLTDTGLITVIKATRTGDLDLTDPSRADAWMVGLPQTQLTPNAQRPTDIDGDGIDDPIAVRFDFGYTELGRTKPGVIYAFRGGPALTGRLGLSQAGTKIVGEVANDFISLSGGSFKRDGSVFLSIISNNTSGPNGHHVWVLQPGPQLAGTVDLADPAKRVFAAITGAPGVTARLADIVDANGDGRNDAVLEASDVEAKPGARPVYLFLGGSQFTPATHNIRINGTYDARYYGSTSDRPRVEFVDVNGDGTKDAFLTDPGHPESAVLTDTGAAWVIPNNAMLGNHDLESPAAFTAKLVGDSSEAEMNFFIQPVPGVGPVVVGQSARSRPSGRVLAGSAYVYSGAGLTGVHLLQSDTTFRLKVIGAAQDGLRFETFTGRFQLTAANAPGRPGAGTLAHLALSATGAYDLASPAGLPGAVIGAAPGDAIEEAFTDPPRDANGDGLTDTLVVSPNASGLGRAGAGRAWIVPSLDNLRGLADLAVDSPSRPSVVGPAANAKAVIQLGPDFDGDGVPNLKVSAPSDGGGRLILMRDDVLAGTVDSASPPAQMAAYEGADAGDQLRLAETLDVTGDGGLDLILASPGGDGPSNSRPNAGEFAVIPGPAPARYFAEGSTRTGIQEYITLENPWPQDSQAQVTYFLDDGTTKAVAVAVPKLSRVTVDVNSPVTGVGPDRDVSASVRTTSGPGVVAERPMYFNRSIAQAGSVKGGHDGVGARAPGSSFFLAEGTTRAGFQEYLTLQNPNPAPTQVRITYLLGAGVPPKTVNRTLPAHSRSTVDVNDPIEGVGPEVDVSTQVDVVSGGPIVAERPIYVTRDMPVGLVQEGDVGIGSAGKARQWFFAEGTTRPGFQEYLTLGNPETVNLPVVLTYQLGDAPPKEVKLTLAAQSRTTVDVNDSGNGVGANRDVSVKVALDGASPAARNLPDGAGFVAERPLYFKLPSSFGLADIDGVHVGAGVVTSAPRWEFAEGTTRPGFQQYLTLQNPGKLPLAIHVVYLLGPGETPLTANPVLPPNSRTTIDVKAAVPAGKDVSTLIVDPSGLVIVERPMYFRADPALGVTVSGGHDGIGYAPTIDAADEAGFLFGGQN